MFGRFAPVGALIAQIADRPGQLVHVVAPLRPPDVHARRGLVIKVFAVVYHRILLLSSDNLSLRLMEHKSYELFSTP